MTRFAFGCALLACLLAPVSAAEDFTGKWAGSFHAGRPDGSSSDDHIFMDLTQKGMDLTGTAGPTEERQFPLAEGKVNGDKVTFQVVSDGITINFALAFTEGHLKGDASAAFPDGSKLSGKVDAERRK